MSAEHIATVVADHFKGIGKSFDSTYEVAADTLMEINQPEANDRI